MKLTEAGKYSKAESILVPLVRTMELKKNKSTANATQQLASVYLLDGKYKEAEDLEASAKYKHEQQDQKDPESLILDNYTLATIYTKEGNYADAEPLFKEAIAARNESLKNPSNAAPKIIEAPRLASLELGLGTLQFAAGNYKLAEETLQEAVKLAEADALEKKSNATPILAEALEQIALVYQANGKYADAEAVCKRGMRMIRDSVGMSVPQFVFAANNLMSIYSDQHRYGKVDKLVQAIWAKENAILRPDHPEILHSKLLNMNCIGHYRHGLPSSQVTALYDRLTGDFAQLYGANSPQMIAPYEATGEYELSIGDYAKAETNLRAALKLARKHLSKDHPRTINILDSLALTLGFKGFQTKSASDIKEAKALVREAISKEDASLPIDNPIRARSLGILASIFAISDDNEGAYSTFHEYLTAAKEVNYEDPIERMRFMKNFQSVLSKLGKKDEEAQYKDAAEAPAPAPSPLPSTADPMELDLK
ncbi:MAG TPA: tetratricopeptide repeat protein [Drouetiella sp.]